MKDYSTYNTYQTLFNVPLTCLFLCLPVIIGSFIEGSNEEVIGWFAFGTMLLAPILFFPSLAVGALIAFIVRKQQLCRNKQDIGHSLLITFAVYFLGGILFWSVMHTLNSGELPFSVFLYFLLPLSLCACLTSWVFSRFLPTEIVNNTDK